MDTWQLADAPVVEAPDGSTVRPLGVLPGAASMARFELSPGAVSRAVSHATVQELWHVVAGSGELWRRRAADGHSEITALRPGVTVSIPLGTAFQFRAGPDAALLIVAATMPPWPDTAEEARPEPGPWSPSAPLESR
jgi:mannose-6-phosphate isomerase-like protein (cupin superfamily)